MHWRKSCECQQNITGTPWFWLRIRPAVGTQWPSRNLVNIDVEKWSISRWFTVTVEFAYQYRIQSLLPSGGCLNPIKPLLNHSPGRCEHCGNRVQKVCIYTVVHSTYMYTICSNIHIWYSINIHIIMFVRIYIYVWRTWTCHDVVYMNMFLICVFVYQVVRDEFSFCSCKKMGYMCWNSIFARYTSNMMGIYWAYGFLNGFYSMNRWSLDMFPQFFRDKPFNNQLLFSWIWVNSG